MIDRKKLYSQIDKQSKVYILFTLICQGNHHKKSFIYINIILNISPWLGLVDRQSKLKRSFDTKTVDHNCIYYKQSPLHNCYACLAFWLITLLLHILYNITEFHQLSRNYFNKIYNFQNLFSHQLFNYWWF